MIVSQPVHIANSIKLVRQNFKGAFLLVEGRDDRLFMEDFVCRQKCKIEVAQGKKNVCEAIRILNTENFPGVLGVVDADFDRIDGIHYNLTNLVMPEFHDLETMLISSPAFESILVELGSRNKIDSFDEGVRDGLIRRALPLGCLRLFSDRVGLGLKFDELNYSAWINRSTFEASIGALVTEVKNNSNKPYLSSELLQGGIEDLLSADLDPLEICNGTDLVEILSIGLRGKLGNQNGKTASPDALRMALRLAYSKMEFRSSVLGKSIVNWEIFARDFQVLKNYPS